ncbi:hypothetical protein [Longimycelium tulufanense]|nr:hypothetical protein [Longimycelium tulufanense]
MTGPEHYRIAEKLLNRAEEGEETPHLIQLAQVHATLALAAAAGLNDAKNGLPGADGGSWRKIAGERRGAGAPSQATPSTTVPVEASTPV